MQLGPNCPCTVQHTGVKWRGNQVYQACMFERSLSEGIPQGHLARLSHVCLGQQRYVLGAVLTQLLGTFNDSMRTGTCTI